MGATILFHHDLLYKGRFIQLPTFEKLLYLYLCLSPASLPLGIFQYIADDHAHLFGTDVDGKLIVAPAQIRETLRSLSSKGFINYLEEFDLIQIPGFSLQHRGTTKGPGWVKPMIRALEGLADHPEIVAAWIKENQSSLSVEHREAIKELFARNSESEPSGGGVE